MRKMKTNVGHINRLGLWLYPVRYKLLFIIADISCVYAAILFSIHLFCAGQAELLKSYAQNMILYWGLAVLCSVVIMVFMACYNNNIARYNIVDALKMMLSMGIGYLVFLLVNNYLGLSLPFIVTLNALMLCSLLLCGYRLVIRSVFWCFGWYYSKRGVGRSLQAGKVLILGAGVAGEHLCSRLIYEREKKMCVMGFLDDDPALLGNRVKGFKVLGNRTDIPALVKELAVEEVIVAAPRISISELREIYRLCEQAGCYMKRYGNMDTTSLDKLTGADISEIKLEDLLGRSVVDLELEAVKRLIRGKVVMVTGGAGSIGSEICSQVLEYGAAKLVVFDFNENGLFFLNHQLTEEYGSDRLEIVLGSVRDTQRLDEIFRKYRPQLLFHAAAHKHVPLMEINPFEALVNNTIGTFNTATAAEKYGVERFVMISTDKAVNPTNYMGASKRIAELVIQYFQKRHGGNTRFATVRFGNVLGSNGSVVPIFQKQIAEGGPITVTDRNIKRYFMTIPEAVHLVLEAAAMTKGGEIFVLNMGDPVYIYELARTMVRLAGLVPDEDIKIEITGLRAGEKLFEEINLSSEVVTPTENQKIFILKSEKVELDAFEQVYYKICEATGRRDIESLLAVIAQLIPSFKVIEDKLLENKDEEYSYQAFGLPAAQEIKKSVI